jgi:hypothetical protein
MIVNSAPGVYDIVFAKHDSLKVDSEQANSCKPSAYDAHDGSPLRNCGAIR